MQVLVESNFISSLDNLIYIHLTVFFSANVWSKMRTWIKHLLISEAVDT